MTDQLTQWARSLFNPATGNDAAGDGLAGPANGGDARTANTKPAPDYFRYRPAIERFRPLVPRKTEAEDVALFHDIARQKLPEAV